MTVRAISVLISIVALAVILFGLVVVAGTAKPVTRQDPWAGVPTRTSPVSHAAFFDGPFADGPSVTRACLGCHADAATEVMQTSHWTWAGEDAISPLTGEPIRIGKRNLQNNFCISIPGNWPRCTSCHVGYGWRDDTFFETATEAQVDCLVCHDTSGQYEKEATGAGMPSASVDLLAAAKSVGRTTRASCGTCHFKGGGGDGVKHGDLDETMVHPPERVDVHMGQVGLVCADCHKGEHHRIRGRLLPPHEDPETRVECTDCHDPAPHAEARLNAHVKSLACQTCHIPQFAVDTGTKMWWDWSYAGRDGYPHDIAKELTRAIQTDPAARAGIPEPVLALFDRVGQDEDLFTHYDKKKGLFLIARRQDPEYRWYDRTTRRYLPGERIDPNEVAVVNLPLGDARNPRAKIWPFKVHRGRQPVDTDFGHLLGPHVFGPGGYWKEFDWPKALAEGAQASGIPFSGSYGWKTTEMFWPQNHMVSPKEEALRCVDCHGTAGRMDWAALGYPGDPAFVLLLLGVLAAAAHGGSRLHPDFELLDAEGQPVLASGAPVSPMRTCAACHDTGYIAEHSYHVAVGFDERFAPGSRDGVDPWSFSPGMFGRWDPIRYRRLSIPGERAFDLGVADWIRSFGDRHAGGGPAYFTRDGEPLATREATEEVDPETHVLGLYSQEPTPWDWQAARIAALQSGQFRWAATATLAGTGLVRARDDGTWAWVETAFQPDGLVPQSLLGLADPTVENCGLCHGRVHLEKEPVRLDLGLEDYETASKGQIFSPQPVRESALNLKDKAKWTHAWDVHAARLVGCTGCHTSLNNPVSFAEADRSRPEHLRYDARRPNIDDYLQKPSHHFTKGASAQGTTARRLDGTMRRCEDCHDAVAAHEDWLPNPRRHLTVMLCETCHVPEVRAPARQQCDWTVLTPDAGPRVTYRGVEGDPTDPRALITGFAPVILPRRQRDGAVRHGPHNLCTSWYWVGGDPARPVRSVDLEAAFFDFEAEQSYHPDVVRALDEDLSGTLSVVELRLDTAAKVEAIAKRLEAVGVVGPRIEGRIQPLSLHHGVVPGAFATRACETCHARDSRLTTPFPLSDYVPYGAEARLVGDSNITMPGRVFTDETGRLLYEPVPTASGRYVIGHDRAGWIDVVGLLAVVGALAGVVLHALLRGHHGRLRRPHGRRRKEEA